MSLVTVAALATILGGGGLIGLSKYLRGKVAKLKTYLAARREARNAQVQHIAALEAKYSALAEQLAEQRAEQHDQMIAFSSWQDATDKVFMHLKELIDGQTALHHETRDQLADLRRVDADQEQAIERIMATLHLQAIDYSQPALSRTYTNPDDTPVRDPMEPPRYDQR